MPDHIEKPPGLVFTTTSGTIATPSNGLDETVLDEFISRLSKLAPTNEPIPPTRKNIICLLDTLVELLEPIISTQIGSLDDGSPLVTHHPTVQLLIETSDLLRDLDNGLTCPTFKPASYGAVASLTVKRRKQQEAWAETINILQRTKRLNLKNKTEAADYLAKRLTGAGFRTQKRRPISQSYLLKLKHRPRK